MEDPAARWREVARRTNGDDYAHRYAEHFRRLAASGQDVHGEAAFVAGLLPSGGSVLDAGCGTGRVAVRLAELGYDVVGSDVDEAMLAVAREDAPQLEWIRSDLASLALGRTFDVVVLAGNVVPFVAPEALPSSVAGLARHLGTGGRLVCGYGLDPEHLPPGAPVVPLPAYDEACEAAGLEPAERYAGWDGTPFTGGGYAVSVHVRGRGPERSGS